MTYRLLCLIVLYLCQIELESCYRFIEKDYPRGYYIMQNNTFNLNRSNLASCLCYFLNGYHMECFRNFYWVKTSALSHGYLGWPWVSHLSLTVFLSLWHHLFILLALCLFMCTDSQILVWLFWCYTHTNDNNNDNNKCISDVIPSL